jgi:hypothetical protein
MAPPKIILHLCADIGSDSRYYQLSPDYHVVLVGEEIGVENFAPPAGVHGIIANPVCTQFSTANYQRKHSPEKGMEMVRHCLRIIEEANPVWWALENPATGKLRDFIGVPQHSYQPWQYGSPWTKKTALWGNFVMPPPLYQRWEDVPKNPALYTRPGRGKPSLAFLHKSAIDLIPEFSFAKEKVKTDADLRSLCAQGFAKAFFEANP